MYIAIFVCNCYTKQKYLSISTDETNIKNVHMSHILQQKNSINILCNEKLWKNQMLQKILQQNS